MQGFSYRFEVTNRKLLTRDFDTTTPWINPIDSITLARVNEASQELNLPESEIRARYEAIAEKIPIKLAWKPETWNR